MTIFDLIACLLMIGLMYWIVTDVLYAYIDAAPQSPRANVYRKVLFGYNFIVVIFTAVVLYSFLLPRLGG